MAQIEPAPYHPDVAVLPGVTISELLVEHEMSVVDLAALSGLSEDDIIALLKGEIKISEEIAGILESAFELPKHFWVNLERSYRAFRARTRTKTRNRELIEFARQFPLKDMIALGWIVSDARPLVKANNLLSFLGIAKAHDFSSSTVYSVAFRKSPTKTASNFALSAWLRKGQIEASKLNLANFNLELLEQSIVNIRQLTTLTPEEFIPQVVAICQGCGVAVVYVPAPPKCYVSGAAYKADGRQIVQLSYRYRSNDHFWFNLFHELAHVLFHANHAMIDVKFDYSADPREVHANAFASETLIPKDAYLALLSNKRFSHAAIVSFAEKIGLAPGIVVGRLHHDRIIPFQQLAELKQQVF